MRWNSQLKKEDNRNGCGSEDGRNVTRQCNEFSSIRECLAGYGGLGSLWVALSVVFIFIE